MTELLATTLGCFPVAGWVDASPAVDEPPMGDGEPTAGADARTREVILDAQIAAGLDRVVEGQLGWGDGLAHPLATSAAVEAGERRESFGGDATYRVPRVVDDLRQSGAVGAELAAARAHLVADDPPLQAVLPGPYALSTLAVDDHYGDGADLLAAIAEFLAGEAAAFPPIGTLVLVDPALVRSPPPESLDPRIPEAVDTVAGAVDADVVLFAPGGAVGEKLYAHLMDADVEALGFDFLTERSETLYNVTEYGTTDAVAAGVVDGSGPAVEEADTVRERLAWIDQQVPTQEFDRLYVAPNAGLRSLSVDAVRSTLSTLAGAAEAPLDG